MPARSTPRITRGAGAFAGGPISVGQGCGSLRRIAPVSLQPSEGLLLLPVPYTFFGYGVTAPPEAFNLDSTFDADGGFAASSNFGSQILSVLELDGAGLRTAAWQFDAGVRPIQPLPIPNPRLARLSPAPAPRALAIWRSPTAARRCSRKRPSRVVSCRDPEFCWHCRASIRPSPTPPSQLNPAAAFFSRSPVRRRSPSTSFRVASRRGE